jgi:hypothetical protein
MKASPGVRSLRAAVFAALCVLLAAGGHALATGAAPPAWVQAAGCLPVFVAGWLLGGRERSLTGIGGATLAAQGGLHLAFCAVGRAHAVPLTHGMRMAHSHSHALTPHATAAHITAALVMTWWLRCGEAALWSLLRWAAALVPGLAAWWKVRQGARSACFVPGFGCRAAGEVRPLRQALLRHALHRRGPPLGTPYAI